MIEPCFICGSKRFKKAVGLGDRAMFACQECGLQRLTPQPSPERLEIIYRNYYNSWDIDRNGAHVGAMKSATFRGYLTQLKRFVSGGRLLDVGCASGDLMSVAQDMGYDVYGVEVAPDGIRICRERFGPDRIWAGELRPDSFEPGFFDVITLSDVIEHLTGPVEFMVAAAGMLRPGGVMLIVTPDASSLSSRLLGRFWPHYKEEHLYCFNRKNLARWLAGSAGAMETVLADRAVKTLTFRYIGGILRSHPGQRMARYLAPLTDLLPATLAGRRFRISFGEMILFVRRLDRGPQ